MAFQKSRRGWVYISRRISGVSGPKFTIVFLFNAGGIVDDYTVNRLSIAPSVPELFKVKVQINPKSRPILGVFGPLKFLGGGAPKLYTRFITRT